MLPAPLPRSAPCTRGVQPYTWGCLTSQNGQGCRTLAGVCMFAGECMFAGPSCGVECCVHLEASGDLHMGGCQHATNARSLLDSFASSESGGELL